MIGRSEVLWEIPLWKGFHYLPFTDARGRLTGLRGSEERIDGLNKENTE